MEQVATPTSAPLLFGRYRVLEQVGEWRLAAVYRATDERLQRKVLLHLLRKDLVGQESYRQRFMAEASANARISHPALLEVFDSGEASNRPFMVTEYVAGRPLRNLGAQTLDQALLYMRQVVGAVALCQSRRSAEQPLGVAHPPISSSNVLLVDEGRVKLVESWLLPLNAVPLELAQYRAPERSEGKPISTSAAVYSLGLLLYELVTGERPIHGNEARAVAAAHLNARIPSLAQTRPQLYLPALEQLLSKATNRIPEQRFADAAALGEALETLWRELGANTQRFELPARRQRQPLRSPAQPATAPMPIPQPDPDPRQPVAPQPFDVPRQAQEQRNAPAALRPVDRADMRRTSILQALVGWLVLVALLVAAGWGGYLLARFVFREVANVEIPSLPPISLPWLSDPSDIFGGEERYLVNSEVGLNMRSGPGTNNGVIAWLPNQTSLRKVGGPEVANEVEWILVQTEVNGQALQGWVSLNYLIAER
jgi:eukaryotic-like serine/threonine-protein kinase